MDLKIAYGVGTQREWYNDREAVVLLPGEDVKSGKWFLPGRKLEERSVIKVSLKDALQIRGGRKESVYLDVEYFDVGNGFFTVLYDALDNPEKMGEIVELHDSKTWMTHRFYLKNPSFEKRCAGNDLLISAYAEFMGNSFSPVAIGRIHMEGTGTVSGVEIEQKAPQCIGNNFFADDEILFDIRLTNTLQEEIFGTVTYTVVDRDTAKVVWEETESLAVTDIFCRTISPRVERYGLYLLITRVQADGIYAIKKNKFAKIHSSDKTVQNQDLGFSDHFAQAVKGAPKPALALMRKGGFGINRDEILWSDFEKEEGVYSIPPFAEEYLKEAERNHIEVCFTLGKANVHVGVVDCPVREKNDQEKWRLYVRNVVKQLKGRVKYYSIYNESNIPLKKKESVHWYVEDLKIAYEEVKREDPQAQVLGFTTACIPYYWLEEAFAQGALSYCDIVDIHPYCWNTSPEEFDFVERVKRVYALIEKYGEVKPVWNTEFGYPVMPKGCGIADEHLQGEYIMHTYLYSRAEKILDKFYIYQFADSPERDRSECERSFGVLYSDLEHLRETPLAAKPAYLMLANMNRMIAGGTCMGETFCHDRMTLIRYQRPDSSSMFAFWAYWNTRKNVITLDLGTDEIILTDRYGNQTVMKSDTGVYEFLVTKETQFVEGNFTKFEDLSSYPA